jgi:hypothetical protein
MGLLIVVPPCRHKIQVQTSDSYRERLSTVGASDPAHNCYGVVIKVYADGEAQG